MRCLARPLSALLLVGLLASAGPAWAGSPTGPVRRQHTVYGFHILTVKIAFQAGQPAVVRITGDGDTNLALGVFDSRGKSVGSDLRPTNCCAVRWMPASSEVYTIKVYNRGGVPNRFQLRTN
jgi:hypothetical protein